MDIFKSFATNADKEVNGAWVDLLSTIPKGKVKPRLLVARLGNRLHAKLMATLHKQNQKELNSPDEDISTQKDIELNVELTARTILLGWEGLEYKGKSIEYSLENAKMLLSHGDFRNLVLAHSRNFDNFRAEEVEEAKKD